MATSLALGGHSKLIIFEVGSGLDDAATGNGNDHAARTIMVTLTLPSPCTVRGNISETLADNPHSLFAPSILDGTLACRVKGQLRCDRLCWYFAS
jgi:hypothetical protein